MRLGIMQPYFFPFLGHFALIASVDHWVVFDVTQYTPKSWMNRNRILHPKTGWQYVTVPLANSSIHINTSQALVLDIESAKNSILGKLSHYKNRAPYYLSVIDLVKQAFNNVKSNSLVSLNVSTLEVVCNYLDIDFSYTICSELPLESPENLSAGDWAPFICQSLGADEYVNPIGGQEIFDYFKFRDYGIALFFAEFSEFKYETSPYVYEGHLSILDVMMWNSPSDIAIALRQCCNLKKAI